MVRTADQEPEEEAEFPDLYRSYSENEKHWQARRAFIVRNVPPGGREALSPLRLDQLLSLSMVWSNHLFMGCSYNKDLLDKVTEMAEGIEIEDVPHFTTRDELMKKISIQVNALMQPTYGFSGKLERYGGLQASLAKKL